MSKKIRAGVENAIKVCNAVNPNLDKCYKRYSLSEAIAWELKHNNGMQIDQTHSFYWLVRIAQNVEALEGQIYMLMNKPR